MCQDKSKPVPYLRVALSTGESPERVRNCRLKCSCFLMSSFIRGYYGLPGPDGPHPAVNHLLSGPGLPAHPPWYTQHASHPPPH